MTTITLRLTKGSPLTWLEADTNFSNLNQAVIDAQATIDTHMADTSGAHAASAVSFSATGNIVATDVQAAIVELDNEKANTSVFTSIANGLVPLSGGGTTNFLRADGTWTAPGGAGGSTIQVDTYTAGTATWTKPAGCDYVEVFVVGGGGGGGSGGGNTQSIPGNNRGGGCGGGAGAYIHFAGPAASFNTTETVVVGAGGAGGAGIIADVGNNGANGGQSSFGSIIAYGGGYGEAGSNSLPTGGGGSAGYGGGANGSTGGALGGVTGVQNVGPDSYYFGIGSAGGWGNGSVASRDGGRSMTGPQGGAGGGDTVNCAAGDAYEWGKFASATMTGGTAEGSNGTTASGVVAKSLRGSGGGGGAGVYTANQATTPGGDGGDGQQPGGGGGGGGASHMSGSGGDGGAGIVVVISYIN